jgi:hypothetical protein
MPWGELGKNPVVDRMFLVQMNQTCLDLFRR